MFFLHLVGIILSSLESTWCMSSIGALRDMRVIQQPMMIYRNSRYSAIYPRMTREAFVEMRSDPAQQDFQPLATNQDPPVDSKRAEDAIKAMDDKIAVLEGLNFKFQQTLAMREVRLGQIADAVVKVDEEASKIEEKRKEEAKDAVKEREDELSRREDAVKQREDELSRREDAVKQREDELSRREDAVKQREGTEKDRENIENGREYDDARKREEDRKTREKEDAARRQDEKKSASSTTDEKDAFPMTLVVGVIVFLAVILGGGATITCMSGGAVVVGVEIVAPPAPVLRVLVATVRTRMALVLQKVMVSKEMVEKEKAGRRAKVGGKDGKEGGKKVWVMVSWIRVSWTKVSAVKLVMALVKVVKTVEKRLGKGSFVERGGK